MLKQKVQYEDFDGATQVETLYFNLNRMELIDLQDAKTESSIRRL
nr:MAG TPA: hypothetical protein [Caudoviricetes sp.]